MIVYIRIQGDSLDSVLADEIRVTVGGHVCAVTTVQASSGLVCDSKTAIATKQTMSTVVIIECSCIVRHQPLLLTVLPWQQSRYKPQ